MLEKTDSIATKLAKQLIPGEIFLLSLPTGIDFIAVFLACLKIGVIPAPIVSPDSVLRDEWFKIISQIKESVGIAKVLTISTLKKDLNSMGFEFINCDVNIETSAFSEANNPQKPKIISSELSNQIAFVQFSSGSTGDPKGVLISHRALFENIQMIKTALRLNASDKILTWLPMYHDMGLIGTILCPLLTPFEIFLMSPISFIKDPETFLEITKQESISVWVGSDSMYRILSKTLESSKKAHVLSSLRICLSGSEPVLRSTYDSFLSLASKVGWNSKSYLPVYGQAENVLAICFSELNQEIKIHRKNGRDFISCGRPIGAIKIQILDDNKNLLSDLIEGDVWIQSPSLLTGYLDDSEKYKENTLGSWFFTGDIGFLKDGELYISGRKKDVIMTDSKKWFSTDLEERFWNALSGHSGLKKIAVIPVGPVGGKEEMAICLEYKNWFPIFDFWNRHQIKKTLQIVAKNYGILKASNIYFVAFRSMPRTTSGKLKRFLLRQLIQKKSLKTGYLDIFIGNFKG